MKQLDVGDHLIQISYDIRQLYPSIPVQDTLSITHLKLINDKTLKEKTKWKPKQIINLLEICIEETHFYDFQGNIWTQTDGLAIGKSISGALTSGYMYELTSMKKNIYLIQREIISFHFAGKGRKMMYIVFGSLVKRITKNFSCI